MGLTQTTGLSHHAHIRMYRRRNIGINMFLVPALRLSCHEEHHEEHHEERTERHGDEATTLQRYVAHVPKVVRAGASRPTIRRTNAWCWCLCARPTARVADDGTQNQQSTNGEVLFREKSAQERSINLSTTTQNVSAVIIQN